MPKSEHFVNVLKMAMDDEGFRSSLVKDLESTIKNKDLHGNLDVGEIDELKNIFIPGGKPSMPPISSRHCQWGVSRRETKNAVEDLCLRKLLLKIDKRLLSLVLREPVPDLPLPSENPTGYFILDMFQTI
jgi:hypothetical protein